VSDRPLYIDGNPTEDLFLLSPIDEVCVWNIDLWLTTWPHS
jgi:hypothetical protein